MMSAPEGALGAFEGRLGFLLGLDAEARIAALATLDEAEQVAFRGYWALWARAGQLPPAGDWRCWLVMAGRGFGKTRTGAEWVRAQARAHPGCRIALVAASLVEARSVMVEGESGVLAVCRSRPKFEPSRRLVTWPNGSSAQLFSAAEPESLRGSQHHFAWADEIGKWDQAGDRADQAWDNLMLGLRLGDDPRAMATTTPRVVPLLKRLLGEPGTAVTRGRSDENAANLPRDFVGNMKRLYGRSAWARQELDGELIADRDDALWRRETLERGREDLATPFDPVRTVVAVDPPASDRGDACGIIVAALGEDGTVRVLADASLARPRPERWARAVADAAAAWSADRVIAEANQGGAMVESVLRSAEVHLPVRLVHARQGKVARAEPVAALYEAGRVRHRGAFPELEDQLCGLGTGGSYAGPGRSPDRADALVWACHELLLGRRAEPRVRVGI